MPSLSYAEGRIYDAVLLSYFVLVGVEVVDRVEAKERRAHFVVIVGVVPVHAVFRFELVDGFVLLVRIPVAVLVVVKPIVCVMPIFVSHIFERCIERLLRTMLPHARNVRLQRPWRYALAHCVDKVHLLRVFVHDVDEYAWDRG